MGYIGVADRSGMGVIHKSERTQSVFFSKKSFNVIDKIENVSQAISSNLNLNLEKIKDTLSNLLEYIIEILVRDNILELEKVKLLEKKNNRDG